MLKIVCGIVLIIGFASTAIATRCHYCSTPQHQNCEDPFKGGKSYEIDCKEVALLTPGLNLHPSGCLKMKLETSGGIKEISRTCYFGDIKDSEKECNKTNNKTQSNLKPTSCYTCVGDLCNSSSTTGAFTAIVTVFAVLVRMMS